MLTQKNFLLKLLYFMVGLVPLLVLLFMSKQDLEQSPQNIFWFGLFGVSFLITILVQKKLWEKGNMSFVNPGTYVAAGLVAIVAIFLFRQLL